MTLWYKKIYLVKEKYSGICHPLPNQWTTKSAVQPAGITPLSHTPPPISHYIFPDKIKYWPCEVDVVFVVVQRACIVSQTEVRIAQLTVDSAQCSQVTRTDTDCCFKTPHTRDTVTRPAQSLALQRQLYTTTCHRRYEQRNDSLSIL